MLMAPKGRIGRLLMFFFCISPFSCETDSIPQGQPLRDWEILHSANHIFRLQFFSSGSSRNRYLGIFYNIPANVSFFDDDLKAVWVANRDAPIPDASGYLVIDTDGRLKIMHSGGAPLLLSSTPASNSSNTSITLLDSGNLVQRELSPEDGPVKRLVWQSFDYPTDTLLPGMKLGIDFSTGRKWSLTSWISDQVPASGTFTLGGDPSGANQLITWWQGDIYWTSGLWQIDHFEYATRLSYRDYYKFIYVSNKNETYLTYSVTKNHAIPRYTIDNSGLIKEGLGVAPFGACSLSDGADAGCLNKQLPECRKGDYWFEERQGYTFGDGFKLENMSLFDCQAKCWSNCSCVAFALINDNGTGCEIWDKSFMFTALEIQGKQVLILSSKKGIKWWIKLIIPVGGLLALLIFCSLCYFKLRKLGVNGKTKAIKKMLLLELEGNNNIPTTDKQDRNYTKDTRIGGQLHLFSFESIVAATNNFSATNKVGQGGFGPVYKGKLPDGQEVAIKRLSRSSGQGLVEFKNEILLIAKLQHANLIKLLGCCIQGQEMALVYEYMPNKSLNFFLFDHARKELLPWTTRIKIVEGIAQGLLYLHKYSRPRIIHRDLKANNILLDDNMNPKISDFGLARIFGLQNQQENTNRVVGTYGYMSPEYAINGIVSMKTDVFSFGVLLLEIVSGKKNNSQYHSQHLLNLIGFAWTLWEEGRALELIDPALGGTFPRKEVARCIHIGLLCVQDHAEDRPTISDVVSMLTNESTPLSPPKQPAYFLKPGRQEASVASKILENYSNNEVSISVMAPR